MREILFRGKHNKKWIYGCLDIYENKYYIISNDEEYLVDEETVGEFTGVFDKNGKKIFEGDIIHEFDFNLKGTKYNDHNFEIRFVDGRFCAFKGDANMNSMLVYSAFSEVVGNKYDNKELLQ